EWWEGWLGLFVRRCPPSGDRCGGDDCRSRRRARMGFWSMILTSASTGFRLGGIGKGDREGPARCVGVGRNQLARGEDRVPDGDRAEMGATGRERRGPLARPGPPGG